MTLDREVLVVAQDRRQRPAVAARRDELGDGREHRRVPQDQADLVRDRPEPARRAARRSSRVGRERLLAEHRAGPAPTAASTASRWAAVHVQTHTTSTSCEQRRRASRAAWRRGAAAMRSARSRSASNVAVTRASTRPASHELAQRERVHRADVPAPDDPDPDHRLPLHERRRLHRSGAEALAHLVDRDLDRPAPGAGVVVGAPAPAGRRGRAASAPRPPPRAAAPTRPSSRTPSPRSTARRSSTATAAISPASVGRLGQRARARDRAEVGVAHLELHRARRPDWLGAGARRPRRPCGTRSCSSTVAVVDVARERLLVTRSTSARGPGRRHGRRGSTRARAGGCRAPGPARRERLDSGIAASSPTVRTPSPSSRRRVAGPTPQSRPTGERVEDVELGAGLDDEQPVRLGEVARELGQQLRGRDPDRRDQPGLGADPAAQLRPRSPGPCRAAGARRATSRNASSSEIGSTSGVTVAQDRHHLRCSRRRSARSAARGTPRAGRPAGHAPSASPSGRRTAGPRSWRRRRRPGARGRRRRPACPAASGRRAARPTRRTRRGRRAGSTARHARGRRCRRRTGAGAATATMRSSGRCRGRRAGCPAPRRRSAGASRGPTARPATRPAARAPTGGIPPAPTRRRANGTNAASTTMPSGSSTRSSPSNATARWTSQRMRQPRSTATASTS